MAQHRKPPRHHARNVLVVTGPILGLPLTTGVAHAAPLDWDTVKDVIARCESRTPAHPEGDPRARNSGSSASGKWQLIRGTWLANGGGAYARSAAQATVAQQELVARRLFLRAGLTPWKASQRCWRRLIGKVAPRRAVPAPSQRVYRVQAGDSLSEIAARSGHRWEDLLEANRTVISDPSLIHVGLSINLL